MALPMSGMSSKQENRFVLANVIFVRISPDSKMIGVITQDGQVRLVDTDSGKDIPLLGAVSSGSEIRFSDNSDLLLVRDADSDRCRVFDLPSGRIILEVSRSCDNGQLSAQGNYLLATDWETEEVVNKRLFDLQSQKELFGDRAFGRLMAMSPDGTFAVFHDALAQKLVIVNTQFGRLTQSLPSSGEVKEVYLSPDNRLIAFEDDRGSSVWNINRPQQFWQLGQERLYPVPGPFSPDGRYIMTIASDGGGSLYSPF